MTPSRAGAGLALLLMTSCSASPPTATEEALSSCNVPSDCAAPPGKCATVMCSNNACLPVVSPTCACAGPADCNDGNPCTTDTCPTGTCVNTTTAGAGCCTVVTDCPAANVCQTASCLVGSCTYVSNGGAGCCNSNSDCKSGATCSANTCSCSAGGKYCPGVGCVPSGGCCSALDCDSARSLGAACSSAGACSYTGCKAGFANCDSDVFDRNGCETNLNAPATCGASCATAVNCGSTVMNATAIGCASGACTFTCNGGFGDCDGTASNGCETNLATSTANCGACGSVCPAPANGCQLAVCLASSCGYAARSMTGCCTIVGGCPAQTDPCQANTCIANTCGTMPVACGDMSMVDLSAPADLAPAPDLKVPPSPEPPGLTLTGGGGCAFAGGSPGACVIAIGLLLCALRRRRA